MEIDELLATLATKLGLESLKLDAEGICRFTVNEGVHLNVERSIDEGAFFVYAPIGLMPVRLREQCKIQSKLLEGNLFRNGTGHASLGYDPDSKLIILFQEFEEESTDPEQFVDEIELLLGFVDYWRVQLEGVRDESMKGEHRLVDPNINYSSGGNFEFLMV